MWGLAFLTFFAVSGGPYGIEDAVGQGGPLFALIGMITIPWIWSLPAAFLTAELSTMLPHNGGFVWWVNEAFGPYWAFQEAYWSFINNFFDLSIYPVMFQTYLGQILPVGEGTVLDYSIRFAVLLFCFLLNFFGVDIVSKVSGLFIVLVLLPFFIFGALGVKYVNPKDWLRHPSDLKSVQWGLFITTIAWNTGGFDNMSQVAGELKDPKRAYPRAMFIVLWAMILTYVFPILVGVSIATDYSKWTDGYFADIAEMIGGEIMKVLMVGGACLKALGVLNTYLCTCSEMLAAWGEEALLGIPILQRRSRWNTPWIALLTNALLIGIGTTFPFEFLIQMDQLFYSIGLILEHLALIWLRFKKPHAPRPYRIPLGNVALVIAWIIPLLFCVVTAVAPLFDSWTIVEATVGFILIGLVLHPIIQSIKRHCQKRRKRKESVVISRTP